MAQNRQLAAPAYLVALALIIIPPLDSLMQVLPMQVSNARWRFGAFGLLSNALLLPLLGVLVAFLIATFLEHYRFRRVLGVVCGVAVLVLAGSWVVFALDVLQVKNDIRAAAALAFKVASATAALKSGLAMLTLAGFAIASFRIPRPVSTSSKTQQRGMVINTRGNPVSLAPGREVAEVSAVERAE